jgi:mono/diheme cytochrome c family protein
LLVFGLAQAAAVADAPDTHALFPDGQLQRGREVFVTYCGGCHGFDGFAYLPYAPSFSMGHRLDQGNAQLMRSILHGRNSMPSWEGKLPRDWLLDALAYLRFMDRTLTSQRGSLSGHPKRFFVFPSHGGQQVPDWSLPPEQ